MAYPFFYLGYTYRLNEKSVDAFFVKRIGQHLCFVFFACVNIMSWYMGIRVSGKMVDMFASSYGFAPLTFLSAISGICCVVFISKYLRLIVRSRILQISC